MKKVIIAAAATLFFSVSSLATTAEAGGGVRLGFGFPLGGFTARPTSQPYHGPSSYHAAKKWEKKKALAARRKSYDDKPVRISKVKKETEVARVVKQKVKKVQHEEDEETTASDDTGAAAGTVTAALTAAAVNASAAPTTENATVEAAPVKAEPAATVAKVSDVEADETAAPAPKKSGKKNLDCRKFIPSVGVTISVRCGE